MGDRVDTLARLARWKIDNFGPYSYKKSDPFKLGIWNWCARVLRLSIYSISLSICVSVFGSWDFDFNLSRYFSIVRNKLLFIHLFPEPSPLSKDKPPFARFILRVSSAVSSTAFIFPLVWSHEMFSLCSSYVMLCSFYFMAEMN